MLWLFFSWYSVKNAKNRVSVVTLALRANQVKQLEQWEGVWVDTGAVSGDGTKKSRATSGPVIELREGTILKTPQINPHKHTASPFVFPDWTMFRILWLFFFPLSVDPIHLSLSLFFVFFSCTVIGLEPSQFVPMNSIKSYIIWPSYMKVCLYICFW